MRTPCTITIATDNQLSAIASLPAGHVWYGIEMPAGWDAGNVNFRVLTNAGADSALVDDGGTDLILTAPAAGETILFRDTIYNALQNISAVKLRASAAQSADRVFFLLSRERN